MKIYTVYSVCTCSKTSFKLHDTGTIFKLKMLCFYGCTIKSKRNIQDVLYIILYMFPNNSAAGPLQFCRTCLVSFWKSWEHD